MDRLLADSPMRAYTGHTVTDRPNLLRQLEEIRKSGYAIDDEEYDEGIRCVGVPVRDYTRRMIAGLSISGPAYRFTGERLQQELITLALEAGRKLSSRLGFEVGQEG